jgi:hypothetical protein
VSGHDKHTPGPWFAHNLGIGHHAKGPYTFPLGTDPDEAAANASLCAAAPEMLAALRQVEDRLAVYAEWADREFIASRPNPVLREIRSDARANLVEIRAAIAKAEGRQS